MKKIGLVLSGGGARGLSHLGVLKALLEAGITPSMISGVSSGAIIGTFFASGVMPEYLLEIIIKSNLFRYVRPAWSKFGFLSIERFLPLYEQYLPVKTFEELQIPMIISATELKEAKTIFFSEGDIVKPILASSCMPVLFVPMHIEDKRFVDGGIINNLPVEPLLGRCDVIIGAHANPTNKKFRVAGIRSMIERTFHLAIATNVKERIHHCDIFIEAPELARFTIFDMKNAKEIFQIGYKHAKAVLEASPEIFHD